MSIVVSEYVPEAALELLRAAGKVHAEPDLHARVADLHAALSGARALVVRNQTRVDRALLDAAPGLLVVGRVGVGLDNLDREALAERDVRATWAPGTNATSVAEYVLGAMLALYRRFEATSASLHAGAWDRRAATGVEAFARTLGLVGLGDIGARVARRARAFGMHVVAADPVLHPSSFPVQEYGVELLDLDELLERSDVVSLHVPLLPSTRGMIGEAQLAHMKAGAVLINTARGGLVDEAALARALRAGTLAGAALDVRDSEPPGDDDPLRGVSNVLLTPHVAGVTAASLERAATHVARDVVRVLRGERPLSPLPSAPR